MKNSARHRLKRLLAGVAGLCLMTGFLAMAAPQASDADEAVALTVTGDGVEKEVKFTMADLQALPQKTYTYSGYNHWPSLKVFKNMTGPTLKSILEAAGLKDDATLIRIRPSGGAYVHIDYTREQLLDEPRYYFPEGENPGDVVEWPPRRDEKGKTPVETIIALNDSQGRLCFGQRAPNEPTGGDCVMIQELCNNGTIEVSTAPLKQWEAASADPPSGTVKPGTKVTLDKPEKVPDNVMVYYTLDGSEPTYGSSIFNISYPYFQPQFNAPIPINKKTTIKTKTIGFGKLDSETATYQYDTGSPGSADENNDTVKPANRFTDLERHWAKDNIDCLVEKGIIDGTAGKEFKPEDKVTRAQFAQWLIKALNIEVKKGAVLPFKDVPDGAGYHDYVAAAVNAGLIVGYGDNTFAPDENMTREQIAAIISRALKMKSTDDISHIINERAIDKFADKGDISPWARQEIALAVSCGIVSGVGGNNFAPQMTATRAEAASMILQLHRRLQ